MSNLPKCTSGPRHKWLFIRNVQVKTQTLHIIRNVQFKTQTLHTTHFSSKRKYKCNCGAVKYGPHDPNG